MTWEKIVLAARIIASIENPNDVCVISARPYGHRAVLKYAANTGAQAIAGRFTPGNFTNYVSFVLEEVEGVQGRAANKRIDTDHPILQGAPFDHRHRPPS